MRTLNCPLCHEQIYSELGKACKMCGMHLDDEGKEFCSKICREKYNKIHRVNSLLTKSLNSSQ